MPKKQNGKREERVPLLLSKHEKDCLEGHAQRLGISVNAFVRGVLGDEVDGFRGNKPVKR